MTDGIRDTGRLERPGQGQTRKKPWQGVNLQIPRSITLKQDKDMVEKTAMVFFQTMLGIIFHRLMLSFINKVNHFGEERKESKSRQQA